MLISLPLGKIMPILHLIYALPDPSALKLNIEPPAKKLKMRNIVLFLSITVNPVQVLHLESELI